MERTALSLGIGLLLLAGCGSANANASQEPDPSAKQHQGNATEVVEGGPNYVAQCAKCHGPTGAGTNEAPKVVGDGALPLSPPPGAKLRTGKFETAQDVFEFVKTNMPKGAPGSLSDDQYYAILAFALKANGVDLQGKKVDPTTAPLIRLPNR